MSFWTTIRRPFVGSFLGGGIGAAAGLGIDGAKGQGMFAKDQFYMDGRPMSPEYQASYDPEKMGSYDDLNTNLNRVREAPQLAVSEQERQATMGRDANRRTAGSAAADARTQLAMRGGLASGARERIAQNTANDVLSLNQQTSADEMGNLAKIRMAGADNDFKMSQMLNTAQQYDTGNQVRENEARNAFALDRYKEQMSSWAAEQNARAVQQSGGKK